METLIKKEIGFKGQRALVLPPTVIKTMENNPLSAILHITDIGFYPKASYHYCERKEPINQYVFIYCTEGNGWFTLNRHTYQVFANQYFILPAGQPHAYGANEHNPWTIYWIHFKGKFASYFIPDVQEPIEIKPSIHSRIYVRNELFEEILHILEMGYSHDNLLLACSTFYHYLSTLRFLQQFREAGTMNKQYDIISSAIHFMKENIEKKLSLDEIAKHVGYSTSHFLTLFNKRTGYSPLAYFNQLKIQQACQLLDFTNMKINQISYKIGIEDTYYFSRLFRKIMGVSPREYKKMRKG